MRSIPLSAVPALALAACLSATPAQALVSPVVGEVSLVVGQAQALGADGTLRTLERGSPVRAGDRVQTAVGGHVHLQFADGGRMSVRPASRLVIEEYAPAQGPQGAIRFRLEEGVVRSITGQWGEAARDRFRLNTPLAAIGVKGTDFAVRADSQRTAASVYTGAIVVAPLDTACASTVGPCLNGQERLLTAAMKGQMLELTRSQASPQFVPAVDLLALSTRAAPSVVQVQAPVAVDPGPTATARAGSAAIERPLSEALVANATRQASATPVVNDLAWGRNGVGSADDTLSVASARLLAAGARPTVGTFNYTLFTTAAPLVAGAVIGGGESSANFRMAGGHAHLVNATGQAFESVAITGAQLGIDFSRLQFNTQLNLASPTLGADSIVAAGSITANGLFYSVVGNQLLAGSVTPNGKEAGYLFEKRVDPGLIRGITLWGR